MERSEGQTEKKTMWHLLALYGYALLLLGIAVACAVLLLIEIINFFNNPSAFAFLMLILTLNATLVSGWAAIHILAGKNQRQRLINILLEKNRDGIKEESFKEAFSSPCGRLIVRYVLFALHEDGILQAPPSAEYARLFREYYIPPWKRLDEEAGEDGPAEGVILFKTPEEGKQWLSTRNESK